MESESANEIKYCDICHWRFFTVKTKSHTKFTHRLYYWNFVFVENNRKSNAEWIVHFMRGKIVLKLTAHIIAYLLYFLVSLRWFSKTKPIDRERESHAHVFYIQSTHTWALSDMSTNAAANHPLLCMYEEQSGSILWETMKNDIRREQGWTNTEDIPYLFLSDPAVGLLRFSHFYTNTRKK